MNLKIKVLRVPDVTAIQKRMLAEIADVWEKWVGRYPEKVLKGRVNDWKDPPDFYHKISVKPGKWYYRQYHHSGSSGGQKYGWVKDGTGLHGSRHAAYPIYPVSASVLRFGTPHSPKTLAPGQSRPSGPRQIVFTKKVDQPGMTHPGIEPRNETKGFPVWVRREYIENTRKRHSLLHITHLAGRRALQRRR